MEMFWQNGPLTVSEIRKNYSYPRPHMNTISTQVRLLESNGFLGHEKEGKGYRYHAIISRDEYRSTSVGSFLSHYYDNSYIDVVSALVKEDRVTVEELEELVKRIKQKK